MICPKAKSATHCLSELFSIYQNKHGTIRRRADHIVVRLPTIIYLRLTDLWSRPVQKLNFQPMGFRLLGKIINSSTRSYNILTLKIENKKCNEIIQFSFMFFFYCELLYTANIFDVIFTVLNCVRLSTVISLYRLHLIAAPSTEE